MTVLASRADLATAGPRSLWEAVAILSRVQEQQGSALREANRAELRRLRSEQAVAWGFVRGFAEHLVARGEAPAGMVERLRRALRLREASEATVREASTRLDNGLPLAA